MGRPCVAEPQPELNRGLEPLAQFDLTSSLCRRTAGHPALEPSTYGYLPRWVRPSPLICLSAQLITGATGPPVRRTDRQYENAKYLRAPNSTTQQFASDN
jgi:hypothetical protein